MAEITDTFEIAERSLSPDEEPRDVDTYMVATEEPTGKGIEFHVSMRNYTQRDMEDLIIEAAAKLIVGRHNDAAMAKVIEAKCIEQVTARADKALAAVTAEIIDQPIAPSFGDKKPVTMREFIGLYGREYLTEKVDSDGKPYTSTYNSSPRIERIVAKHMAGTFQREIEKATNTAIAEIRLAVAARHKAMLDAEKARFREYLAKAVAP